MTAMKDERMLILSMLQEGKITAEEAASLLEALGASRDGDEGRGDVDGAGRGHGFEAGRGDDRRGDDRQDDARRGDARLGGGRRSDGTFQVDLGAVWDDAMHLVGKAKDRVEEAIERTRRRMSDASRRAEEAREQAMDAGRDAVEAGRETWAEAREQAGELRREAMDAGREALEASREAMESGKHALRDAREQVRGAAEKVRRVRDEALAESGDFFRGLERGLSKVAAELPEAVSRLMKFDFGPGAYKEVNWHYEGGFEAEGDAIQIFASTDDGKIRIEGVDGDEYRVDLMNKVWAADEEEAAFVAKEATRWETFGDGLRLVAGLGRDVQSDIVMKLPRGFKYELDLQTSDGNVELKDLDCVDVRVNSADGNVRMSGVTARGMQLTTANGSLRLDDVVSDKLTALTSDGSVRLTGDVGSLSVTASDGSVSATYAMPKKSPGSGGIVADGIGSDGSAAEGIGSDGSAADGIGSDGSAADGIGSDGSAADGIGSDGSAADGIGSDRGSDDVAFGGAGDDGEFGGASGDESASWPTASTVGQEHVDSGPVTGRERIEWNVRSSDGSVRITVPRDDRIGYELDLTASDGTVRVQVPGVEHAGVGTERRGVHVFTPGFAAKPVQFVVRARTADGSVSVRASDGEGA